MRLEVRCELSFELSVPTPFNLMLRPKSTATQWIESEAYQILPDMDVSEFSDAYGNLCQRLIAPVGTFDIKTTSIVNIKDKLIKCPGAPYVEIQNLPDHILSYLLPSRYCESDRFGDLAMTIVENATPGYDQVAAIETWIRTNIQYLPGSSDYPLTAVDINQRQYGVCRDLAHLGIALCRSLSIPARLVGGYLLDLKPMDMHAWFEAYIDHTWYTFDATQDGPKEGYVAVAFGKDAADIAMYNQYGPSVFPLRQVIQVKRL